MKTPTRFPSSREYNTYYNLLQTNCLAFAFGRTMDSPTSYDLLSLKQINLIKCGKTIPHVDICEAFIKKAKEFGYTVKQIADIVEANNKVLFIVFGWYSDYIKYVGTYDYFFHIIRRNEREVYEHKLDWYSKAKTMSDKELLSWLNLDIERYYFVLD